MLGAAGAHGFGLDDDEEDEDEQIELDEVNALKKDASKTVGKGAPEVKKAKDVQGFQKGGDLEKSLKDAKKNAVKNAGIKA